MRLQRMTYIPLKVKRCPIRVFRRGFDEIKAHSHGATARAIRHARSPHRVRRVQGTRTALQRGRSDTHDPRRDQEKFARRHRESERSDTPDFRREGSARSRQIPTGSQRERSDAHGRRRGVRFVSSRRAYPRQK